MMFGYSLLLSTESTTAQVRDHAAELLGVSPDERGQLWCGDLLVTVSDPPLDPPWVSELSLEQLGVPATTRVGLAQNKSLGDAAAATATTGLLLLTAARLAVDLDAEACLTYEGEVVVMRRRAGDLVLFTASGDWSDPATLERVPQPWSTSSQDERF